MLLSVTGYHLQYVFTKLDSARALSIASSLFANLARFKITSETAVSHFLSQAGHESNAFKATTENLNYKSEQLVKTWPSRFSEKETKGKLLAGDYEKKPEKIANTVYAGRIGNTNAGDGWKYRGRGFIQLTGKSNYQAFADFYKKTYTPDIKLMDNPDLLATDVDVAMISALWFFQERVLNKTNIEAATVEKVTSLVNGGQIGIEERKKYYYRAMQVFSPNFLADMLSTYQV